MSELQQVWNRDLNYDDRDRYGDSTCLHSGLPVSFQIPLIIVGLDSV